MGGSVSSGKNNDELVDNLVEGGLIKTPRVERVFRAVDRGAYYLPDFRDNAYRDLAWREGFFHLSAPCIYSRVMEALDLQPGHNFLNIGSGTGYFSTMAGLIIGSGGLNHNVELHKELVDYANKKLVEFVKHSAQFDDFDFCIPQFVNGNVLNLVVDQQDTMICYDRIYVGVGVSDEHEQFMKSLLKVHGVLVMPLNDSLVKIKRVDQDVWETQVIMTCSFASLVKNTEETMSQRISLPKPKPMSLQEICRFCIRNQIRRVIESEHPDFYKVKRFKSTFNSDFVPKGLDEDEEDEDQDQEGNEDESDHRDDEDDSNDTAGGTNRTDNENIFENIHQLFLPHRNTSTRSNHIQNQLRLMIYGRLLDSNQNTFAIELQRNPDRSNQDDDDDDDGDGGNESEDQQSEESGNNSYYANVTREISLNENMMLDEDGGEGVTSKQQHNTPANSLKSIQETSDELLLRADACCLEISTDSGSTAQSSPPFTGEQNGGRRQNLLAVVQNSSSSSSSKQQQSSSIIPIPLKMTTLPGEHKSNNEMGRSSESGFQSASASSSSSASSPYQAKAGNSNNNSCCLSLSNASSDSETSATNHHYHGQTAETRLLLRKRNYSSDIYSESITAADVDDNMEDFGGGNNYPAKKVDLSTRQDKSDETTRPKESDLCDDGDGDGDVSLSGVKLSAEFQKVREMVKPEQMARSGQPNNLMQSKINELPVSKILKNFLSYHRKAC